MALPDRTTFLTHLDADLAVLAALEVEHLDAAVPACPGWDVARLLDHLGRVHRMVLSCLDTPDPEAYPGFPGRSGLVGDELLGWFRESAAALRRALHDDDPDRAVPTFLGTRTVDWWIRRQAHEHLVHRWDAQAAIGDPDPLDPGLAADGVTELLELRSARGWAPPTGVRGTVHLHGTDAEGEWFVELDDPLRWRTGHQKGDTAVRGTVSDLDLLVWGRVAPTAVEVLGDPALLDALLVDDF